MSERLTVELPDSVIDAIVEQVTERVLAELRDERSEGRWLTGAAQAADYLGCSTRRVYNLLPSLPHSKEEGRLVFHTRDLDEYRRGLS